MAGCGYCSAAQGEYEVEDVFRYALEHFEFMPEPGRAMAIARQLSRLARARCEPEALAVARRFHTDARFYVYERLLNGPRAAILDLVDSCPGALVLGAAARSLLANDFESQQLAMRAAHLRFAQTRSIDGFIEALFDAIDSDIFEKVPDHQAAAESVRRARIEKPPEELFMEVIGRPYDEEHACSR